MSLLKRLNEKNLVSPEMKNQIERREETKEVRKPKNNELRNALYKHLVEEIKKKPNATDEEVKDLIEREAAVFLSEESEKLNPASRTELINDVKNELIGFGPITPLINNPDVSEVMVNGPNQIYIEQKGKLIESGAFFRDDEHVLQVIEKIVSPLGRRIDESSPMVDARLPDGSRVNAIIPPLSLNGPCITIRKFPQSRLGINDLIRFGTLTPNMAKFLEACVKGMLNIFISGGTGSGKTTLLNVLSSFIPSDERIVTIKDAAELKLHQTHVVSLETKPPNIEGKGEIGIRDLMKNSLRMRPDRIIVGEVRSGEALDMLQAMNTGHDGSLATGHSNSPREMLSRLETMVLMAGMELPVQAIRKQIAGAIDIFIQQSRMKDGSRKITHITEVVGMEEDTIALQDIFVYEQTGTSSDGKVLGRFTSTGIRPKCSEKLSSYGIELPAEWFDEEW